MNNGEYDPFVLAVLPKSEAKEIKEARFDLVCLYIAMCFCNANFPWLLPLI